MLSPILQVFRRLLHCSLSCFTRERSRTHCLVIGQQSCAYACAYVNHVLTGNNNDTSIIIRRTQGFDILMLMLMLMSPLPSLAQKLLMLMLMLALLVRTGL